jgi:triosephosphate isomerase (TIM)
MDAKTFQTKLVVANWKLNPKNRDEAIKLAQAIEKTATDFRKVDIIVCPPFVFLQDVKNIAVHVGLGGQNVYFQETGAYTGEIAPEMLKSIGVQYVIIGHSERRKYFKETDEDINKKVLRSLEEGLKVILCVGEHDRDPEGTFHLFIKDQLQKALRKVPKKLAKNLIVAYEPVWAIGSGKPDTPKDTREVAIYIRKVLHDLFGKPALENIRILYGGSVIPENTAMFLDDGHVDGLLVGGSSLNIIVEISSTIK